MSQQTPKNRVLFVRRFTAILLVLFGVFSLFLLNLRSPRLAQAATSSTINFQARLETASGAIAADGNYNVEFKLYSASSGGTALWTEDWLNSASHGIHTSNGYLSASLGSITAFPGTINWDQPLWITMNIGGTNATCTPFTGCSPDGEMSPRLALTAVPYAFRSGQLATTNAAGTYTSTLGIQAPTGGNQTFQLQDQGAAGTYNLLTMNTSTGIAILGTPSSLTGKLTFANAGSANTVTLTTAAETTASATITIPNTAGANDTVCLVTLANCTGVAGGGIGGSGTASTIAMFTGSGYTVGNSIMSQTGTTIGVAGTLQATTINANTVQTNGTQRIDSSGNLSNIGTYSGSGNITTTGGVLSIGGSGTSGFSGSVQIGSTGLPLVAGSNGTIYQGILANGSEQSNTLITGFLNNELSNADTRGATISTAVTGGASITQPNYVFQPGYGDHTSNVSFTSAGTAQWTETGLSIPVPSRAIWTPYLVMRAGQFPSQVKVEIRRSDNTTWDTAVNDTAPSFSGGVWVGPQYSDTYYPLTGVRFTLTYSGTTSSYVREVGLQNVNTEFGAHTLAALNQQNIFRPDTDAVQAFQVQNAAGTPVFNVDTTNKRIGIGTATPAYPLDVVGDINTSTQYRIGGTVICTASGCTSTGGSGNYIQNTTSPQTANFNITGQGTVGAFNITNSTIANDTSAINLQISSGSDPTLGPLSLQFGTHPSATAGNRYSYIGTGDSGAMRYLALNTNGSGAFGNVGIGNVNPQGLLAVGSSSQFTVDSGGNVATTGTATIKTTSTAAFQIQNTGSSTTLLTADTQNSQLILKSGGTDATLAAAAINTSAGVNDFPSGWGAPAGWTLAANSATHTSGTTALASTWTPTVGVTYQVSYNYTNCSSTNILGITMGGATLQNGSDCVGTNTIVITATSTAPLTFTPATTYTGVVSNVTVQAITQVGSVLTIQNSAATPTLQIRSSGSNSNIFIGLNSGANNTSSGTNNTAVGTSALQGNTTGAGNTATGYEALFSNTSGVYNTANGVYSLQNNTTGNRNTANGVYSLWANTTGSYNTASGINALFNNTTGSYNTATGALTLQMNTTGGSNTASGFQSLSSNTTGGANTASGSSSLQNNTTGSNNTATGNSSLINNTAGNFNTASGDSSLYSNTSGYNNTASGYASLYSNSTGTDNAAMGYQALFGNTTGSYNTASGESTLSFNTTGSYNTALGYKAGARDVYNTFATLATLQNATAIGAYAQVQANNSIVLGSVDNATKVGIGITVPSNTFSVSPLDYQTGTVTRTNGSAALAGTGTTWTSAMVGDIIVFADGTTNTVASFTNATSITMGTTYTGTTDANPVHYRFHKVGFQVASNGNVGVGTTAPSSLFSVGSSSQLQVDVSGNLSTTGTALVKNTSTAALQVQNAGGGAILTTNTSANSVSIGGVLNINPVSYAAAPTVAIGAAGSLTGTYYYAVTFVTANGETNISPTGEAGPVSPSAQQVNLTNIPTGPAGMVTARKIYRSTGYYNTFNLVGTINDNVTTTFTDNNTSPGVAAPGMNQTGYLSQNGQSLLVSDAVKANTFVGTAQSGSPYLNVTGNSNTSLGSAALNVLTTGNSNTAVGSNALFSTNSGSNNVALGTQAMQSNSTGSYNSGIGMGALLNNTTGANNVALGSSALYNNQTGVSNTGIGYNVLNTNTTGSYNTALGYNVNVGANNLQSATAIGANSYVTQSNSLILGCVAGTNSCNNTTYVGIGNTAPVALFSVGSTSQFQVNASGAVQTSGSVIASSFQGNGASLTSLNATNISSGTLAIAYGGTGIGTTPGNGQILIGNGSGYTLATLTAGNDIVITNTAGGITISAGDTLHPAAGRIFSVRRSGTTDNYSAGSFVSLMNVVLPSNAPAGTYSFATTAVVSSTSAATAYLRVNDPNGADQSADMPVTLAANTKTPLQYSGSFTWAGGTGTIGVSVEVTAGTGAVYDQPSTLFVTYIGP